MPNRLALSSSKPHRVLTLECAQKAQDSKCFIYWMSQRCQGRGQTQLLALCITISITMALEKRMQKFILITVPGKTKIIPFFGLHKRIELSTMITDGGLVKWIDNWRSRCYCNQLITEWS
ncbi:uncharacterized protein LOC128218131 [Mya arenaria]|uniref:uncharacterized protein LOC128218131 n=1 Tax=Mya arenaria TaxID=6604 RepID=UPI0022E75C3C|nr:uncharacterized protein LOC128218131 [Mya arenaria]